MRAIVLVILAAAAFGQMPDKAYDTLKAGLADGNPAKRIAAVLALGVARPEPKPVALPQRRWLSGEQSSGHLLTSC
jgi:hypothetical protein